MLTMQLIGKTPKSQIARPSAEFALPSCLIGLEYEWEGCGGFSWDLPTAKAVAPWFSSHADGSLRNSGIEFVLKEPLFGENLLAAVTAMDDLGRVCKLQSSYRTSMHVHLDMEGTTFPDAPIAIGALYAIVEPFLYRFVGQKRDYCNYCLPWHHSEQHFETFLDQLQATGASEAHAKMTAEKLRRMKILKYAGLNYFSLGDFGTVEFRQAPVGMSRAKVIQWLNIIMCLKKHITGRKPTTPQEILERAYTLGPELFLKLVFEEHYQNVVRFSPDVEQDFRIGVKTAAQFCVACISRDL